MGPIKAIVYREDNNAAVFEKIIYNDKFIKTNPTFHTEQPELDSPCIMCQATGKIEVCYGAKKVNTFSMIETEKCPICGGKGYFRKD